MNRDVVILDCGNCQHYDPNKHCSIDFITDKNGHKIPPHKYCGGMIRRDTGGSYYVSIEGYKNCGEKQCNGDVQMTLTRWTETIGNCPFHKSIPKEM